MEFLMTLLVGMMFSTMLCSAFYLGFKYSENKKKEDAVVLDGTNKEAVKSLMDFLNYRG